MGILRNLMNQKNLRVSRELEVSLPAEGVPYTVTWPCRLAVKNKDDHIDPRERILRHAQDSEENPYWITPAYQKTQPKPIFRETDPDEPEEKMTKRETFG